MPSALRRAAICTVPSISDISENLRHVGAHLQIPTAAAADHFVTAMFLQAFPIWRAWPGAWPASCEVTHEIVVRGTHDDRKKSTLIVFSMEIVVADQMRTALLRTLGSVLEPTRVAPGCLSARLFSDLDKRKGLLLVEEWETRDQFERNLDTAKLNAIVGAIELSSEAPVVRVDTVEREEGVDTLALHRSGGRAMSDERAAMVHSKRTT